MSQLVVISNSQFLNRSEVIEDSLVNVVRPGSAIRLHDEVHITVMFSTEGKDNRLNEATPSAKVLSRTDDVMAKQETTLMDLGPPKV